MAVMAAGLMWWRIEWDGGSWVAGERIEDGVDVVVGWTCGEVEVGVGVRGVGVKDVESVDGFDEEEEEVGVVVDDGPAVSVKEGKLDVVTDDDVAVGSVEVAGWILVDGSASVTIGTTTGVV